VYVAEIFFNAAIFNRYPTPLTLAITPALQSASQACVILDG